MAGPSDKPDESPDFSFLGGDSVPDAPEADAPGAFNFSEVTDSDSESPAATAADTVANAPPDFATPNVTEPAQSEPPAQPEITPPKATPLETSPTETAPPSKGKPRTQRPKPQGKEKRSRGPEAAAEQKPPVVATAPLHEEQNSATSAADQKAKPDTVSRTLFSAVAGYAAAVTVLFLYLWLSGGLSKSHQLESLPDISPLPSNEFQHVPESAALPPLHDLKLGESRRFGDVILTPERVSLEPVTFVHMSTGEAATDLATPPVLKLWLRLENVSDSAAFPPWDLELMCHRSPAEGMDDDTRSNSWLMIRNKDSGEETRVLNLLHSPSSSFDLVDFHSRKVIQPGEALSTFVASEKQTSAVRTDNVDSYRWRIQLRKGVNANSGNGVTTLVDIHFAPSDIDA